MADKRIPDFATAATLDNADLFLISAGNETYNVRADTVAAKALTNTPDFSGATQETAGARGLVPAPARDDRSKVLKGSGGWSALTAAEISVEQSQNVDFQSTTVQGVLEQLAGVLPAFADARTLRAYINGTIPTTSGSKLTFREGQNPYSTSYFYPATNLQQGDYVIGTNGYIGEITRIDEETAGVVPRNMDITAKGVSIVPAVSLSASDISTQLAIGSTNCNDVQTALEALLAISGSGSSGAVSSVNGKTGEVFLDADDIDAQLPGGAMSIEDALYALQAEADGVVRRPRMNSINHRGYSTVAPENTLPAFLMSKARGFDMVETDIKFTSDGKAVLLHDETINRTARNADGTAISGDINISDITYAQSQGYDFGIWKNAKYAGTKIPTLAQFLKLCKENGLHPYLEMKSSGLTQTNIQTAVNEVKAAGMIGRVTWISFNHTTLEGIAQLDSVDRLGLIVNEEVTQTHISAVKGLDSTGKRGFIDSTNYSAVSIAACQNANIPLEVWGINSATERSVIQALPVYVSGVTSAEAVASEIIRSNKGRRHDSTHLCIPRVTQNGLGSDGNAASTSSENQDVLTDFIPVLAGEVYEVRYRVPVTKSPVIRYATFDAAFTQLSNDYSSTPYDTVNGYRIRNLQITIAQDGYLRVSCRSYGVASFGLVRVKDADGVLLPSLERVVLDRIAATDAALAPMTAPTSQAAGTGGLVPAPPAGDMLKFLRGDGTWANVNAYLVDFSSPHFSADCVEDALEELYTAFSSTVTAINTALAAVVGGGSNA